MSCERQWISHGVISRYWGDVAPWEFLRSLEAITGDERFDDLRYVIIDCVDVRSLSIDAGTRDDITALCVGAQCTNGNIRLLIVSDNPELVALLQSMMSMHPEKTGPVKSFSSVLQARKWLEQQPAHNEIPSRMDD